MKAIKKSFENLKKVCDSITRFPYSQGVFVVDSINESTNTICLSSDGRDCIGSTILSHIPSNYQYGLFFHDNTLYLTIWF